MATIVAVVALVSTACLAQVVLTVNSTINFGIIEFQTTHSGSIGLGTNGSVTITGSGLTYDTGAAPGRVRVTTTPATGVITVKCTTTAKLKGGNTTLNADSIQISINSGVAFGSGSLCQGIKNGNPAAATVNLTSTPNPWIYIGGRLVIASNQLQPSVTSYTSANPSGQAITLRVVFQ